MKFSSFIILLLQIALDTAYWNIITHIVIWASILFYIVFIFLAYSPVIYITFGAVFTYVGVPVMMFGLPAFWFSLILVCIILILPILAKRAFQAEVQPMLADKVRLEQRMEAVALKKAKKNSLQLKNFRSHGSVRDSSVRSSSGLQRGGSKRPASLRSGYAFSHQEGFGEIITKGVNMRNGNNVGGNEDGKAPHASAEQSPDLWVLHEGQTLLGRTAAQ